MGGVLAAYDKLVTDAASVNQLRALQLLFDLKFLANILAFTHDDSEVSLFFFLFFFFFFLLWFQQQTGSVFCSSISSLILVSTTMTSND